MYEIDVCEEDSQHIPGTCTTISVLGTWPIPHVKGALSDRNENLDSSVTGATTSVSSA